MSSSGSTIAFGRTTIGSIVVAPGPNFWSRARTPATTIAGVWSGLRSRHSTSSRCPIVSTLGLTRSNGSVSHAGKWTTSPSGMNWVRSS